MNAIVRAKDHLTDAAENATNKLLSIIDQKSQAAKSELEHLIGELQQLRQGMDDQGKRVQQQITEFASLTFWIETCPPILEKNHWRDCRDYGETRARGDVRR